MCLTDWMLASTFYLGRKYSLVIYSLVFILGAGLMLGANGDRGLGLIYAGRVLAGIGVGASSMIVSIAIKRVLSVSTDSLP